MTLKAILLDLNGVIINDEPINQQLIDEILLRENLRLDPTDYQQLCLGRGTRACLKDLLARRGRILTEENLNGLITAKVKAYQQKIASLEELPIYPGVKEILSRIQSAGLSIGLVTGAIRAEVELILKRLEIHHYFNIIITGDESKTSKPDPDIYFLAVELLNQQNPALRITPEDCLVIENTAAGIIGAKNAGMQVVGVANTYPFHMLQRQTNWTVDYLVDLELERIQKVFAGEEYELLTEVN